MVSYPHISPAIHVWGGGAYAIFAATPQPLATEEVAFHYLGGQTESTIRRVKPVAKYLVLWEVDSTRVPVNAKERGTAWLAMVEMVKASIKKGFTKDWGSFPGELNGYSIHEGTELELMTETLQYAPYVKFEVHPVASLAQVEQVIKASTK